MRILRAAEHRVMPWRNGRGVTREIIARPEGEWGWRLSVANVDADDEFSRFEGVDRLISVIDGAGMVLTIDGVQHRVGKHAVFGFSGDAETRCRLIDGPVRDLNLMTKRALARGQLEIARVEGPALVEATAVVVLEGALALGGERLVALDAAIDVALQARGDPYAVIALARTQVLAP